MNYKTIQLLKILLILLIAVFLVLLGIITGKLIYEKQMIKKVSTTYTQDINLQNDSEKDIIVEVDGNSVLGILKIDKIKFEGLIFEGTSDEILKKGVGHFDKTPILEGNACFAAHNYWNRWAKLHTLENGDTITYISYLGTKEYEVFKTKEIDETDWSLLQNTDDNIITLITCIKNKPEKRFCLQAKEKF